EPMPEPAVTQPAAADESARRSRPRAEDVPTRLPVAFWERIKILLLLVGVWGVLLVAAKGDNPLLTWPDAVNQQLRQAWIWLALGGAELLRQFHYLICEHSAGYNQFWSRRIFGRWNKRIEHTNDWN